MRIIIVAETPSKYLSFEFEKLKKNREEIKFGCWSGAGNVNIILQNFPQLKFIFLTNTKAKYCLSNLDKNKYKLILLK